MRESPYPGGGELPRKYYRTLDPFVALTAAAVVTSRLVLGTGVALLPQRDVIHTAKQVASLDVVSGGRVAFGVGVGWNREEMRNHGTDPATRGVLMDEQLAALKQIWTSDQAEHHGEHVDFAPVHLWPKPVQEPYPPIYVGGRLRGGRGRGGRPGSRDAARGRHAALSRRAGRRRRRPPVTRSVQLKGERWASSTSQVRPRWTMSQI